MGRLILLLLPLLATPPAAACPDLAPFTARYAVIKSGFTLGHARRRFTPEAGGEASLVSTTRAARGLRWLIPDHIVERSRVRCDGGLRPLAYRYDRQGGRKEEHYALDFDWQAGVVHYRHDGRRYPLVPDTHDLLSFQLALMRGLKAGRQRFTWHIMLKDGPRRYHLHRAGSEIMTFAHGPVEVVRVVQEGGRDGEQFTFWCAPALDYVPLRIVQRKRGRVTELRLERLNGREFVPLEEEEEEGD